MAKPIKLGESKLEGNYKLVFYNRNEKVTARLYQERSELGKRPLYELSIKPWTFDTLPTAAKKKIEQFFQTHKNLKSQLKTADDMSDDDDRMQALLEIIKKVIEVEDFGKALEIIEEENITDSSMESELREMIVDHVIALDDVDEMDIAIQSAREMPDEDRDRALVKIIKFLIGKDEFEKAIEAFELMENEKRALTLVVDFAPILKNEDEVETLLGCFEDYEEKELVVDAVKKLVENLIDKKKMNLAMEVAECLGRGAVREQAVIAVHLLICKKMIASGCTEYVIKITKGIIELDEVNNYQKCPLIIANIIKTLKAHSKPALVLEVQGLLDKVLI